MAIENEEQFRAWLDAQPQEVCVAIACRAALRVLPFATRFPERHEALDRLALRTMRAILTSGVAAMYPTPEVWVAGAFAHSSAIAAASKASSLAHSSTIAAASAAASAARAPDVARATAAARATEAALSTLAAAQATDATAAARAAAAAATLATAAIYADADLPPETLTSNAVSVPDALREAIATASDGMVDVLASGGPWQFWAKWYAGAMAGEPLPWGLQKAVALIPEEIWDAGPEAVAEEIARVELAHRTHVSPRLVKDSDAQPFRVEADPLPPDEVVEFACQRIEIAFRVALDSAGANGFDETSPEASEIALTLSAPRKSISVLATGFYAACLSFNSRIGDIYPEDTALVNLKNVLWGVTDELCDLDEMARQRCARLAQLETVRPVDDADRQMAAKVPEMVADQVDDKARGIIESDVERILSERRPPKTVRVRFTNWMTTISIWMDRGMKTDKRAKWLADLVERLRGWWGDPPV